MIFHNFLQINDTHGVEWQFKDIFVFIICSNVDIFLHHPISFHLINVSEKQEGKIRWPLQHEKLSISDYLVVGQCHKVLFFWRLSCCKVNKKKLARESFLDNPSKAQGGAWFQVFVVKMEYSTLNGYQMGSFVYFWICCWFSISSKTSLPV